jgi:RecB family exonuclease
VRDYKTGKNVAAAGAFERSGTLQIQLYMLVAERVLGLAPVAGLYHPLGAAGNRRPRGLVAREDERLQALGVVNTDRREADEFRELLEQAEARAIAATRTMREGRIARLPLNGECPSYCALQPICRLERALGAVGEEGGGGSERNGGGA